MRIPDHLQATKGNLRDPEYFKIFEFNLLSWGSNVIKFLKDTFNFSYIKKTASFTQGRPNVYLCNATGGAITATLLTASKWKDKSIWIKKTDSSGNAVTVDGNASETIDGATTNSLSSQYDVVHLFSDGTDIHIL